MCVDIKNTIIDFGPKRQLKKRTYLPYNYLTAHQNLLHLTHLKI